MRKLASNSSHKGSFLWIQASDEAHSLQRQPWDQGPPPGAVPHTPAAEGGVYTTSASPAQGECGAAAAQVPFVPSSSKGKNLHVSASVTGSDSSLPSGTEKSTI